MPPWLTSSSPDAAPSPQATAGVKATHIAALTRQASARRAKDGLAFSRALIGSTSGHGLAAPLRCGLRSSVFRAHIPLARPDCNSVRKPRAHRTARGGCPRLHRLLHRTARRNRVSATALAEEAAKLWELRRPTPRSRSSGAGQSPPAGTYRAAMRRMPSRLDASSSTAMSSGAW